MTPAPVGGRIFHLLPAGAAAEADTGAGGSVISRDQFERHGFVHCCFREQITEIATWWFDPAVELVALEIDPAALAGEVRIEPSPTRWYPHVYAPLDAAAVVQRHRLPRSANGVTTLPPPLAMPPPSYRLVGRLGGSERSVTWRGGVLGGDPAWLDAANKAVAEGHLVELVGAVVVPATLSGAYESFSLLVEVVDELVRYDGDGFFEEATS